MSVLPAPDEHVDLAEFDRMYWLLRGARARGAWDEVEHHLSQLLSLFPAARS